MSDVKTNLLTSPSPPGGNRRAPKPSAREVASALEREITPRETAVLALGLGLIGILISVFFTHLAGHRSLDAIAQTIYRSNLALARALATRGSQSHPRTVSAVLEDLDAIWRVTEKPFSNSFMCVMDHEARLLRHTLHPNYVGSLIGDTPIMPRMQGGPTNLLGLIQLRTNWSGRTTNFTSFNQLVAYAYAPEFDGLVAVHVPAAVVDQEIHTAQRPWFLALIATGGLVPAALSLLFWNVNLHRRALLRSIDKLRSSEARFQDLYDQAPVMYMTVDLETDLITECNQTLLDQLGYNRNEIVGQTVHSLYSSGDPATARKAKVELLQGRCINDIEQTWQTKAGLPITVQLGATGVRDASGRVVQAHTFARDITPQKAAKEKLRATEKLYRQLFENVTNGFAVHQIVVDEAGRPTDYVFLQVNRAWSELTGLDPDSVRGQRVTKVIPGIETDTADWIGRYGEVALTSRSIAFEHFSETLGRFYWVQAFSPQPGQFATVIEDITARRQAEQALRRAKTELEARVRERTRELELARDAANSASRIKSDFLNTMSHELRTPLNSICGFARILLRELAGPLNAEQRKQLGMLENSATHLARLTNEFLDLARIESGRLRLTSTRFDLTALLRDSAHSLEPQLQAKGLALLLELPKETVWINSDEQRIRQVLLNLLANAVKHTANGHVGANLETLPSPINGDEKPWICLRIFDTGPGIQVADQEQIFQPFFQLHDGEDRAHPGTGLGLGIARQLVRAMGGSLSVESTVDKGSTFVVKLPLETENPSPPAA